MKNDPEFDMPDTPQPERLEWTDQDEADFLAEKEYYDQLEKDQKEYKSKWPNHCPNCKGWGFHSWFESHGEPFQENCENCIESGGSMHTFCPRCRSDNFIVNEEDYTITSMTCNTCGFILYETEGCPGA